MRVSTQHTFDFFVSQIQSAQSRMMEAERQVLSGKKFEVASESPSEAHTVITAKSLMARVSQLDNNLRSAKEYLGNTEEAFGELNNLLNHANTIAINGSNSTYDQAARDGMVREIAEIQRRVAFLGNSSGTNGKYVFSGQKTTTRPFTESPPNLTFNGDDNPINVEIRPNETMRVNLQGAGTMFTNIYSALEGLKNDLASGDIGRVGTIDLQAVQDSVKQVTLVRGDVGTKLQTINGLSDQNQKRIDDLSIQISDVQGIDLSEAISNMQAAQTAYTAALQVTAKSQGLSLMDFLR